MLIYKYFFLYIDNNFYMLIGYILTKSQYWLMVRKAYA